MKDFITAITRKTTAEEITVIFKDGAQAVYTMEIFELLKRDKSVDTIYSNGTGEVYYSA